MGARAEAIAAPRVASNDAGLAHGASRSAIRALARRRAELQNSLRGLEAAAIGRALRRRFGGLVLCELVERLTAVRTAAVWVVLLADDEGAAVPTRITLTQSGIVRVLRVELYRLRISAHCAARILQRTVHSANLGAVGPLLLDHLMEANAIIEAGELEVGTRVQTRSAAGTVCWRAEAAGNRLVLVALTWLNREGGAVSAPAA